jgi:hypothetical protein
MSEDDIPTCPSFRPCEHKEWSEYWCKNCGILRKAWFSPEADEKYPIGFMSPFQNEKTCYLRISEAEDMVEALQKAVAEAKAAEERKKQSLP